MKSLSKILFKAKSKMIRALPKRKVKTMSKYFHILDAGHGGINPDTGEYVTPGKRSPVWSDGTQYFEGKGNREIVSIVSHKLTMLGIDHGFTVFTNNWRDVPLTFRVKVADKFHRKKSSILWSVHSNGSSSSQANGYEVYTSVGPTKSDIYADIFFKEFSKMFPDLKGRKDTKDGDFDKESQFYILRYTLCPAILIESMFHTNERECKMLMDPGVQEKIAQVIVNTILIIERDDKY